MTRLGWPTGDIHIGSVNVQQVTIFKKILFMWIVFKIFIEFVAIFLLFHVLVSLTARQVGSYVPDQGSNLHPLHWKAKT